MIKTNIKYSVAMLLVVSSLSFYGCSQSKDETPSAPKTTTEATSTKDDSSKMESTETDSTKTDPKQTDSSEPSSEPKMETSAVPTTASSGVPTTEATKESAQTTITKAELKKATGENGTKALVAVNGLVYDVTNAEGWKNGKHKGGITAGNDLSAEIMKAPHGLAVLDGLKPLGKLGE